MHESFYVKSFRLSDHKGRMCRSGFILEVKPQPLEKVGSELQPSGRMWSEAFFCRTEGLTAGIADSHVLINYSLYHVLLNYSLYAL